MKQLPSPFLQQIQADLGNETTLFLSALAENPPVSIRFNPRKQITHSQNHPITQEIAWNTEGGYYLPERPVFTLDPAFHAGAYYVQEASSMFIAEALSQVVDFQQDITVLDLCAAPGGKTTLLASLISENSVLLANEVIKNRVDVLKENVVKWGYPNVFVSNHDSEDFQGLNGFFDVVVIDAPCSGEGLFRKDERAIGEWSPENVQNCAARQKRILTNAVKLLKPNGVLLYSTCTYNDFENSNNIDWLLQNFDYQEVKLALKPEWGITEKKHGYQFYPHKTRGEGFYCCVLKKSDALNDSSLSNISSTVKFTKLPKKQIDAVSKYLKQPDKFDYFIKPNNQIFIILKKHIHCIALMDSVLKRKSTGLEIGEFKGHDFIPSHDFALSCEIKENTPSVNLDKNAALHYLKKENIEVENDAPQGWVLAQYAGVNLGWMKVMKNRINNYLPKDFRIRMDLPREN